MIQDVRDITSFKWGTITGLSPLAVRLDGDSAALALIPDSLVDPLALWVGARVRVELSVRKVVIHGVANGGDGFQSGDLVATARSTARAGWLMCEGQSLLRADYPSLFTAIGTTYGAADSTHFNIPNSKGRVLVARDTAQPEFDVVGETGGEKAHTLTIPEMPSHQHTQALGGGLSTVANVAGSFVVGNANTSLTSATGGGQAHNNLPPYLVVGGIMIKI